MRQRIIVGLISVALMAASPHQNATVGPSTGRTQALRFNKERVTFKSGDLTLVGYLYKPDGAGPFPGIIWNHGSEKNPGGTIPEFDSVAAIFVPAGYVVFAPIRRGHGLSQGEYISDAVARERQAHGTMAAQQEMVKLMEGPQLDDQLAGLAVLIGRPYVDKKRLAVVGCSYGGIETLLAAEHGAPFRAAIAISPGAESWNGNVFLRERLIRAVGGTSIPVLIIHPAHDANLAPGFALGQEFQRLGKSYGLHIYPPVGPIELQGHCFGGAKGFHIFGAEAVSFLGQVLH